MHSAFACKLGATVLAGLTNLDATTNPEVRSDIGIGSQFPQFAAVVGVKPRIAFQSRAVESVLTQVGTTGSAKFTAAAPFIAYWAALVEGALGTNAVTYTMDNGLLVPRRLTCQHRQDAQIDCEAIAYSSDGDTDPMTIGAVTELPAITQDNVRHTLKSAQIAGVDLGCITDVSIDFGVNADTLGCKSNLYDTAMTKGQGITAVISITTLDVAKLGASGIPLKGKGATHANSSIVFRQRATDGVGYADPANDLTITANGLATYQQNSGQGPAEASATVQVTCSWDGTNSPLIIT